MPRRVDHEERRTQIADALIRVAGRRGLHALGKRPWVAAYFLARASPVCPGLVLLGPHHPGHFELGDLPVCPSVPAQTREAAVLQCCGLGTGPISPNSERGV